MNDYKVTYTHRTAMGEETETEVVWAASPALAIVYFAAVLTEYPGILRNLVSVEVETY